MQKHQLQARDLMDCGLEHFLLAVGLPEQLSGKVTGLAVCLKHSAIALEPEQLLWWDVNRQLFAEVHLSGAVAPCCP